MELKINNFNRKIVFIEVKNEGKLSAIFSNFGAGVFRLRYDNKPLILEFEDKEKWLYCKQFYGKTLGRVAGRIRCNGEIDGEPYSLVETSDNYSLHGGYTNSLSFKPWKYKVKEYKNRIDVIFEIKSKDLENGFPGDCKIRVTYQLFNNNNFKIVYKAKTSTKTLVNLSNHNYYNFFNSKDVSDYVLKVNASNYGEIDETIFITSTEKMPWYLDFERATKLNGRLNYIEKHVPVKTIDNTFVFNSIIKNKPQAILKNKDCKLSLYTDYPAMNIFCDDLHEPIKFTQFDEINNGRRALALEPQLYNFDTKSLVLRKGETYSHFILLKIKDLSKL